MNEIVEAISLTRELWIFLGILGVACLVEESYTARCRRKLVDNPTLR